MKISISSIKVDPEAIEATLLISLDINPYCNIEAPISVSGKLLSGGKVIALLNEYTIKSEYSFGIRLHSQEEKEKIYREKNYNSYYPQLTAVLSPKAIEHIEYLREKDPEKSVKLSLDLIVKHLILPVDFTNIVNDSLLKIEVKRKHLDFIIKHSDWVNHYTKILGIGNFLLLELRIPDDENVSEFWKDLYAKLYSNLQDIEHCLRAGDWQKAMFFTRKYYENAKIGDKKPGQEIFREEFDKLLIQDQHNQEGIRNLYDALWKLFEFFSKYVHDRDKNGNLQPLPVSTKEDAYFAYALALGFLNLLGKKVNKQTN